MLYFGFDICNSNPTTNSSICLIPYVDDDCSVLVLMSERQASVYVYPYVCVYVCM